MVVGDADLLIAYVRRGDIDSLTTLVKRHEIWLMAFLRGMLSIDDAEDAFQQVWIRVIKSAVSYRGGVVKSYLAHIARTVAIDIIRKSARHRDVAFDDPESGVIASEVPSDSLTPREECEKRNEIFNLRREIFTLSQYERQVLLLRIEGELTFQEIAKELKKPLGTVLALMSRATEKLKKQMGE